MNRTALWGTVAALCLSAAAASAQETPAATQKAPLPLTVATVTDRMTKALGIPVLADSAIAGAKVTPLTDAATEANLEAQLDKLVAQVKGAAWAKVYLPEPQGKRYTADAVSQFAFAQANLFGRAGESKPGMVEILGKQIPEAQAAAYVTGLGLKPYYVLTSVRSGGSMTPQQRQALVQSLVNDPVARQQYMMEHAELMGSIFSQLPAGQRGFTFAAPGGATTGVFKIIDGAEIRLAPPPPPAKP